MVAAAKRGHDFGGVLHEESHVLRLHECPVALCRAHDLPAPQNPLKTTLFPAQIDIGQERQRRRRHERMQQPIPELVKGGLQNVNLLNFIFEIENCTKMFSKMGPAGNA